MRLPESSGEWLPAERLPGCRRGHGRQCKEPRLRIEAPVTEAHCAMFAATTLAARGILAQRQAFAQADLLLARAV